MYEKHGGTHEKLYAMWRKAIRTVDTSDVLMFSEWFNGGYRAFRAWALANGYKEGLSLKRKNVKEGYYPDNLEFVSKSEARRKSRYKLTNESVRAIRRMLDEGNSYGRTARAFGVSFNVVSKIARGVTYEHVK